MHNALVKAIKFIKKLQTRRIYMIQKYCIYVYNEYQVLNKTQDHLFLNKCLKPNNNNQCLYNFF